MKKVKTRWETRLRIKSYRWIIKKMRSRIPQNNGQDDANQQAPAADALDQPIYGNTQKPQDCDDACTVDTESVSPNPSCSDSDAGIILQLGEVKRGNGTSSREKYTRKAALSLPDLSLQTQESQKVGDSDLCTKRIKGAQHTSDQDEIFDTEKKTSQANSKIVTASPTKAEPIILVVDSQPRTWQILSEKVQFEVKYSGLAATTLLCFCVANLAIYDLLYTIVVELVEGVVRPAGVYATLMVTGLLLLRSTGFLWLFLTGKRYRASKKHIQKGLERGSGDARFYTWIEERERLKVLLEVIGFYLCYISLYFFWNKFLLYSVDQKEDLLRLLPSTQHRSSMPSLLSSCEAVFAKSANATSANETCESPTLWGPEDVSYIYRNVAKTFYYQYNGYGGAPLLSFPMAVFVSGTVASLSIVCLSQLGYAFIDHW